MAVCNDCKHYDPTKQVCRAHPPVAHMVPSPKGVVSLGIFPPCQPDNRACGEFVNCVEVVRA